MATPLAGPQDISEETIALVRNAQADTTRAITTSTGLIGYDLEAPSKVIVPTLTPALNSIPRKHGPGIDVTHWKAITAFNTANVMGTNDEGATPQDITYATQNLQNTYQTTSLMNSVTFQAQWRGRSLEGDVRAKRTAELLYALKVVEEQWVISGSSSLWAPAAPLLSTATTGGSITAATNWLQVTAVSANGESLPGGAASVVTTGTTSTITLRIFTVPNAASYNVYGGTGSTQPANGSMWKQTVTANQPANPMQGSFTVTLTAALATSGTNPPTTNTAITFKGAAGGPLMWDGIQSLVIANAGSFTGAALGTQGLSSYVAQPADAVNAYLALADVDTALLQMFLYARANPDFIALAPADNQSFSNLVIAAGEIRYVIDAASPGSAGTMLAGQRVTHYLNKTTGKPIPVEVWPYLPQGSIIIGSRAMPYPVPEMPGSVLELEQNQEYYEVEYPPTAATGQGTKWSFADMVDETLKLYFLGGFGIIRGVVAH